MSVEKFLQEEKPLCSFCKRSHDEVKSLVSGQNAYICNECIVLCGEIIEGIDNNIKEDMIEKINSGIEMLEDLKKFINKLPPQCFREE